MKKNIPLLIVFVFILSACSLFKSNPLHKSEALMFEASSTLWNQVNEEDDFLKSKKYKLAYKGDFSYHEEYNISGIKNKKEVKISEKDLEKIYDILQNKVKDDKKIIGADGTGCDITFYDENAEELYKFDGNIYDTHKEETVRLLDSYIDEL